MPVDGGFGRGQAVPPFEVAECGPELAGRLHRRAERSARQVALPRRSSRRGSKMRVLTTAARLGASRSFQVPRRRHLGDQQVAFAVDAPQRAAGCGDRRAGRRAIEVAELEQHVGDPVEDLGDGAGATADLGAAAARSRASAATSARPSGSAPHGRCRSGRDAGVSFRRSSVIRRWRRSRSARRSSTRRDSARVLEIGQLAPHPGVLPEVAQMAGHRLGVPGERPLLLAHACGPARRRRGRPGTARTSSPGSRGCDRDRTARSG